MRTVEIQDVLLQTYSKSRPLAITNYTFTTGYEADVVMVTPAGTVYEYEVKTSRSDFKKDFTKKGKHISLGKKTHEISPRMVGHTYPKAPTFFYYACVPGLIKKTEIPPYAGLVYVEKDSVKVIKPAPKLHNHKLPEKFQLNIGRVLSLRSIYGSSYLRYKHK